MADLFSTPPQPKADPREKRCKCGSTLAHCVVGNTYMCRTCAPADFMPAARLSPPETPKTTSVADAAD